MVCSAGAGGHEPLTVKNPRKKTTSAKMLPKDGQMDRLTNGQRDCCMDKGMDGQKDGYSLRDSWMKN